MKLGQLMEALRLYPADYEVVVDARVGMDGTPICGVFQKSGIDHLGQTVFLATGEAKTTEAE